MACLGFGGRGEEGLGKWGGLEKGGGEGSAPGGAMGLVFEPSGAREIAADNAFDGEGGGGAAAGEAACIFFWLGNGGRNIESEDVVRLGGGQGGKPELGDGGEECALAGDGVGEDDVVGGDTIGGDEPDFFLPTIDVADLARAEKLRGLGHGLRMGSFSQFYELKDSCCLDSKK